MSFPKTAVLSGSPPLTRGIHIAASDCVRQAGITPAYAGNTVQWLHIGLGHRDHPRLRGEYFPCRSSLSVRSGSPPLTRGILYSEKEDICGGGITPAYAGNTGNGTIDACKSWDHPRLRGEYLSGNFTFQLGAGSPPLTRGIQWFRLPEISGKWITPAYAGNTGKLRKGTGEY